MPRLNHPCQAPALGSGAPPPLRRAAPLSAYPETIANVPPLNHQDSAEVNKAEDNRVPNGSVKWPECGKSMRTGSAGGKQPGEASKEDALTERDLRKTLEPKEDEESFRGIGEVMDEYDRVERPA